MKYHIYVDADGYRHRVLLRDADSTVAAARIGIPADPPDLAGLDGLTDEARREVHNALVNRGLFTWQDVISQGNGVKSAIAPLAQQFGFDGQAAKREIVRRYRGR